MRCADLVVLQYPLALVSCLPHAPACFDRIIFVPPPDHVTPGPPMLQRHEGKHAEQMERRISKNIPEFSGAGDWGYHRNSPLQGNW